MPRDSIEQEPERPTLKDEVFMRLWGICNDAKWVRDTLLAHPVLVVGEAAEISNDLVEASCFLENLLTAVSRRHLQLVKS